MNIRDDEMLEVKKGLLPKGGRLPAHEIGGGGELATQRIAALELALAQTQHLLHQDDLTPLLNRRGFRHACDRWTGNSPTTMPACCAMIDLDDFKAINDRYSHTAGDAALVHFAATLRRHLRPADIIARLGGDEFALILRNCCSDDAYQLLERLQQALGASPLLIPDGAISLHFSAGVADLHIGELPEHVLARADAALLDAKRQGKAMVTVNRASVHARRDAAEHRFDAAAEPDDAQVFRYADRILLTGQVPDVELLREFHPAISAERAGALLAHWYLNVGRTIERLARQDLETGAAMAFTNDKRQE